METVPVGTVRMQYTVPEMQKLVTLIAERHGFPVGRSTPPGHRLWLELEKNEPVLIETLEGGRVGVGRLVDPGWMNPALFPQAVLSAKEDAWEVVFFSVVGSGFVGFSWAQGSAATSEEFRAELQAGDATGCEAWAERMRMQGWAYASRMESPPD